MCSLDTLEFMLELNTMSMSMSVSKLTVLFFFFYFFFINELTLNNVTLILSVDMNDDVSIETHIKYDKLVILRKKKKKR
jgi:hypothetical protein